MKRTRLTSPQTTNPRGAALLALLTGLQALGIKKLTELAQRRRPQEPQSVFQRVANRRMALLLGAASATGGALYFGRSRARSVIDQLKTRLPSSHNDVALPANGKIVGTPPDLQREEVPVAATPPSVTPGPEAPTI
jgi:hypothetical protein